MKKNKLTRTRRLHTKFLQIKVFKKQKYNGMKLIKTYIFKNKKNFIKKLYLFKNYDFSEYLILIETKIYITDLDTLRTAVTNEICNHIQENI